MTISDTDPKVTYVGNGSTTAFPVPFQFFGEDEIEVIERVIATGAETTKVLSTDYTVTGGDGATGTVTALTAPPATVQWVIKRATDQVQETDYVENDPFPAAAHEAGLDRVVAMVQDMQEELDRSLKFKVSDPANSLGEMPASPARANKVAGYDGDGKPTVFDPQDVSAVVSLATGSLTSRLLADRFAEVSNVKDFGAAGDGVTDDTAAILAAQTAAARSTSQESDVWPYQTEATVYFPPGIYRCANLVWDRQTNWLGAGPYRTILQYNGANSAAGSCVIKFASEDFSGAVSGGVGLWGFSEMTINGFSGGSSGQIAEYGIRNNGPSGLDWGFRLFRINFQNVWGDHLDLGKYIINCYLDHMRFDNCGRHCMTLDADASADARHVFSLQNFTCDNNIVDNTAEFEDRATALSVGYDGIRWGRGLMKITGPDGLTVHIKNGRIECNKRLRPHTDSENRTSLIYNEGDANTDRRIFNLENVHAQTQNADATPFIRNFKGRISVTAVNVAASTVNKLVDGGDSGSTDADYDCFAGSGCLVQYFDAYQAPKGITLGTMRIEARSNTPTADSAYVQWKRGDRVLKRNVASGGTTEWVVTAPSAGWAYDKTDLFSASVTATNGNTTIPSIAASVMRYLGIRLNVHLDEDGGAGTLDTTITAIDVTTGAITLADAPTWSGATTMTPIAATFTASGIAGGVQAAVVAALTENGGAIGGTNDGNLPDLSGSPAGTDAAFITALIAAVRELAAKQNAVIAAAKTAKQMASS